MLERARWAVDCRGVVKTFRSGDLQTTALDEVDLTIDHGELVLLVGPSGCGKTTLISAMAGLLTLDRGSINVLGTPLHRTAARDLPRFRRRSIGFIFQHFNLLPSLSALDNVAVPLILNGQSLPTARRRGGVFLEQLGLGRQLHSFPRELSGGQLQRVAIARGLVHDPRLIVCDEPTASLDAESGCTVMALLRDSTRCGDRSVIVVTHDERILPFADRIERMSDGRILPMVVGHRRRESVPA